MIQAGREFIIGNSIKKRVITKITNNNVYYDFYYDDEQPPNGAMIPIGQFEYYMKIGIFVLVNNFVLVENEEIL
jgi:hypothetical protein